MKNLKKAARYTLIATLTGLATIHQASAQDIITTVAGGGPSGIPAVNANLSQVGYLAYDAQENLYIADYGANRIYKISSTSVLTIVAGNGAPGYGGDGGLAVDATLNGPIGVAVDNAKPANVYFTEFNGCLVRKVDQSTGIITTIAGTPPASSTASPVCGYSGDGGEANKAELNAPTGIALDPTKGDLYIAEYQNGRVRKVAGGLPTGTITSFAGGGGSTTSANNCAGSSPYGDGGSPSESYLCYPQGVTLDNSVTPADVFITEGGACTVREVVGSSNTIYLVAGTFHSCGSTNSSVATSGQLADPEQILVSVSGATTTLTTPQWSTMNVRQFTLTYKAGVPQPGALTTIAGTGSEAYCGDGGPAIDACFNHPYGVAVDSSGNLYIGDGYNDRVRKITKSTGDISTIAGWGYNGNTVTTYSDPVGISGVPATGLSLYEPGGVSVDPSSTNVYIAGYYTPAVYKFNDTTGLASTVAGNGILGFAGDGSAANGATTELNYALDTAADSSGNVYIADQVNCAIREVVASTGDITTIAGGSEGHLNGCGFSGDGGDATKAQLYGPTAVIVDSSDNLYIADSNNCNVRKVVLGTGIITTVAGNHTCGYDGDGGLATAEELNQPNGLGIDAAGDLFISDQSNNRVRMVDGVFNLMTTVAGDGNAGYSGDGVATANSLNAPAGAVADANGNLFISDLTNNILRWVDPAGTMVTFAGEPAGNGFSGDGGVATSALLSGPRRLARDASGNTYFPDSLNNRIRKVTPFAGYGRSTSRLDFTKQQIGTTSEFQPITLSAIGTITISGITLPAGFAETDNCTNNELAAGDTCEIDVTFSPTKGGVTEGMLSIASDAFFKTQGNTVDLEGEGGGLSISGSLAFGTQLTNNPVPQTVTLENTGSPAKLTHISIPDTGDYTVTGGTCQAGNTIATNATCTIAVTFKSGSTGTKKGALTITSNDPASPLLAAVTGTATELTLSPTSLAFGTVTDGETKTLDLTVTNSNGSFTITPTIAGAGFTILTTGNTCATAIAAGASCTLPIQFAPTAVEAYSGTLTLVTGDATSPTVALTGAGATNISVTPTSISFATITEGTKETTNLTLKNLGTTALSLKTSFSGTGAAAYSIATTGNTCGTSLAAAATCTLPVQFAPTAAETYTASLLITTNGGTNPTVALTGTGKASAAKTMVKVVPPATTTTLTSSLNPSTLGAAVKFTATVRASAGITPAGTVTFKNGTASLGTVGMNGGVAVLTTSSLPVGTLSITATYSPTSIDRSSVSAVLKQVVNQ